LILTDIYDKSDADADACGLLKTLATKYLVQ